jgi:type II secretory pathway pseudopilin PulG
MCRKLKSIRCLIPYIQYSTSNESLNMMPYGRASRIWHRGFDPLEISGRLRERDEKVRFLTGFTLTEVVMASALLIIALVPILKALTSGHVTAVIIQRRSHSLMLAQAKLDEIRARSIYNYIGGSFTQSHLSLDGAYLCNIDDDPESSNLRKITISVGYDQNSNNHLEGDEVEVTLSTYFARRW